jgi:CRISPR system Cascade subunit CasD
MSETAYLALYFDAPLQSWGYASKFDRRTSLAHPTRSGVIGLLCAALGVDRTDTHGLARLDALTVTVYAFRMGCRLTDYHTIGGGYDPKRTARNICRRASGGVGDTVQTWREYLEGSRFGAVVSADATLVDELAAAVRNPVWGIWLGRKACIPAARVFEGVHAAEEEALASLCRAAGVEGTMRVVREAATFVEGNDTVMDRPLDFSPNGRRFAPRRILVE